MGYTKKLRIVDDTNTNLQLDVYINSEDRVFLNVGELDKSEWMFNGYITLDKDDVQVLIDELNELKDAL